MGVWWWVRVLTAGAGFLVALLTLRDAWLRVKAGPDAHHVDRVGVVAYALLVVATACRSLQQLHDPFDWEVIAYPTAYLLGVAALALRFSIPGIRRFIEPKRYP